MDVLFTPSGTASGTDYVLLNVVRTSQIGLVAGQLIASEKPMEQVIR